MKIDSVKLYEELRTIRYREWCKRISEHRTEEIERIKDYIKSPSPFPSFFDFGIGRGRLLKILDEHKKGLWG